MASAGQAQAQSSQPTHFSRPSGCRLSWCRPWKRGWVGTLTSGYSSVTTRVNIVVKVTPKPAILSLMLAGRSSPSGLVSGWSATADLLLGRRLRAAVAGGCAGGHDAWRAVGAVRALRIGRALIERPRGADERLARQRRHRVPAGERVERLGGLLVPGRLEGGLAALVRLVGEQQADHQNGQAGD